MSARFRYALEPVRLTRQWDLDALQIELGQAHTALAELAGELDAMNLRSAAAAQEWRQLGSGGQLLSVERYALLARYIGQCRQLELAMRQRVAEAEAERDRLIGALTAARRALDAVEDHRDEMKAVFVRNRRNGDFKVADDQWNILQAGSTGHDHQS